MPGIVVTLRPGSAILTSELLCGEHAVGPPPIPFRKPIVTSVVARLDALAALRLATGSRPGRVPSWSP